MVGFSLDDVINVFRQPFVTSLGSFFLVFIHLAWRFCEPPDLPWSRSEIRIGNSVGACSITNYAKKAYLEVYQGFFNFHSHQFYRSLRKKNELADQPRLRLSKVKLGRKALLCGWISHVQVGVGPDSVPFLWPPLERGFVVNKMFGLSPVIGFSDKTSTG